MCKTDKTGWSKIEAGKTKQEAGVQDAGGLDKNSGKGDGEECAQVGSAKRPEGWEGSRAKKTEAPRDMRHQNEKWMFRGRNGEGRQWTWADARAVQWVGWALGCRRPLWLQAWVRGPPQLPVWVWRKGVGGGRYQVTECEQCLGRHGGKGGERKGRVSGRGCGVERIFGGK